MKLIVSAAVAVLVLVAVFFSMAGGDANALSGEDRAAIDGYNKLIESCQAGQGGCRAAEAQRAKFNSEGICLAVNEEQDRLSHGGFYRCMPR
ncbi:hypothetical protein [Paracoccus sp. SSK6]|uniref:hypothetical protein n=1 Tax=Paracoccus sp. SSK6 TaxID=3143131 RepID=UPI00321A5C4F